MERRRAYNSRIMSKKPQTDPKLLELLVCPMTGALLEFDVKKRELISLPAKLAYPVRDGVPVLVSGEARQLTEKEISKAKG